MGLDTLLEAAHHLADRQVLVVLAGDGPDRAKLMRKAAAGPMRDRVLFPGRLSEEDLDLAYRAADVFILPTLALECFGLIVLEALARGCPVLGSKIGAIPELVEPVLPGWLFPPGDAEALSARLRDFLDGRLEVPPSGRLVDYVKEHFAMERIGNQYLSLLFGYLAPANPALATAPSCI